MLSGHGKARSTWPCNTRDWASSALGDGCHRRCAIPVVVHKERPAPEAWERALVYPIEIAHIGRWLRRLQRIDASVVANIGWHTLLVQDLWRQSRDRRPS